MALVTLYQHKNYGGAALDLDADVPDLRVHHFNDFASSLRVAPGYRAILYGHINYGGTFGVFGGETPDLGIVGWNDVASSIKIQSLALPPPIPPPATPSLWEQLTRPTGVFQAFFSPQNTFSPLSVFSPTSHFMPSNLFSPQNFFSPQNLSQNIFSPLLNFDPITNMIGGMAGGFASSFGKALMGGFDGLAEVVGPLLSPIAHDAEAAEGLPDSIRPMLTALGSPLPPIIAGAAMLAIPMLLWSVFGAAFAPVGELLTQKTAKLVSPYLLDPFTLQDLYRRKEIDWEGAASRLDPQGWKGADIALWEKLAWIVPPLADMVRFADYSAFDPVVIEQWREFYDAPDWISEPFSLIGVTGEWANRYWFSHWRQPGRFELEDMFWRRVIDEDSVRLAYRTQGYTTFWQDALIAKIYTPFTRVDVRRMWDIGVLTDEETILGYQDIGYSPENARKFLIFTKLFQRLPDLRSRFKKGWINEEDLLAELVKYGLTPERAEWELTTLIEADKPERVEKERDLTKAEIYKGVKKEVITWEQGVWLLMDLNYDEWEANYILTINVGVLEGSPEGFIEYKDLTQRWRQAQKMPSKVPPKELIDAERLAKAIRDKIQEATARKAPEAEINQLTADLAEAKFKFEYLRSLYEA